MLDGTKSSQGILSLKLHQLSHTPKHSKHYRKENYFKIILPGLFLPYFLFTSNFFLPEIRKLEQFKVANLSTVKWKIEIVNLVYYLVFTFPFQFIPSFFILYFFFIQFTRSACSPCQINAAFISSLKK